MANSANFAQILQPKPSIFEIVAAESLDKTLFPALNKILEVFVKKTLTFCYKS